MNKFPRRHYKARQTAGFLISERKQGKSPRLILKGRERNVSIFYGETVDLSGGSKKEQSWGGFGHIGDCKGPVTTVRESGFGSTSVRQRCLSCHQEITGAVLEKR